MAYINRNTYYIYIYQKRQTKRHNTYTQQNTYRQHENIGNIIHIYYTASNTKSKTKQREHNKTQTLTHKQ